MAKTKLIVENRKAYHEYEIHDRMEAGMELKGTEIKSLRQGKVQLKDSYISIKNNEAFLKGAHISIYDHGNRFNHDETRDRRLLLHKAEIRKLDQAARIKGFTIIPLKIYLSHGLAKMELGVAKGKNIHDKRETEKRRQADREIQKALKNY